MSFERGTFFCLEHLLFLLFGQTFPPSTPAFFAPPPRRICKKELRSSRAANPDLINVLY